MLGDFFKLPASCKQRIKATQQLSRGFWFFGIIAPNDIPLI